VICAVCSKRILFGERECSFDGGETWAHEDREHGCAEIARKRAEDWGSPYEVSAERLAERRKQEMAAWLMSQARRQG
jgi:hypothetical protein